MSDRTARLSPSTFLQDQAYRFCNGEVNISHETTTMVVWIYDGI